MRQFSLSLPAVALTAFTCVAFARPAWADSVPDWVKTGQAKAFPPALYLVGVGSGSSLDGARDSARGDLAKQFSVKINAVLETEQASEATRTGDGWVTRDREKARNVVRTKSQETLQGVQVPQSYVDEKAGLTYALAVLERGPAAARLTARIAELDRAVDAQLKAAGGQDGAKIPRLRALNSARQLLTERDALNSQLNVLDPAGRGRPSAVDRIKLRETVRQAQASVRVFVDAPASVPADLQSGVAQTVTELGMSTAPDRSAADLALALELAVQVTDRLQESGFIYSEGVLTTRLDVHPFQQLGHVSRMSAKDGGKSEAEATRKALRRLREKLTVALKKDLTGFLSPIPDSRGASSDGL